MASIRAFSFFKENDRRKTDWVWGFWAHSVYFRKHYQIAGGYKKKTGRKGNWGSKKTGGRNKSTCIKNKVTAASFAANK